MEVSVGCGARIDSRPDAVFLQELTKSLTMSPLPSVQDMEKIAAAAAVMTVFNMEQILFIRIIYSSKIILFMQN